MEGQHANGSVPAADHRRAGPGRDLGGVQGIDRPPLTIGLKPTSRQPHTRP